MSTDVDTSITAPCVCDIRSLPPWLAGPVWGELDWYDPTESSP